VMRASGNGDQEIWGLFNRGAAPAEMSVKWGDVGTKGSHKLRDLWSRSDVKWNDAGYAATVPSHGVAFIRVSK
jgi:alpha-galactosidase